MQYTFVDRMEAPAAAPDRAKRRIPGVDELVAGLEPAKVAKIALEDGEKPRVIAEQLFRTAARQRKLIDVYEVGGVLYAEMISTD
ncbi:MAG TPA: hypothetical protein VFU81_16185 [Thermomicrobiales bacterium]|nr:hypothetical protein [Thermomicrobiales bacterium]